MHNYEYNSPFQHLAVHEPCGAADFRCDNGQCVPAFRRCDLLSDCQDGSDELQCGRYKTWGDRKSPKKYIKGTSGADTGFWKGRLRNGVFASKCTTFCPLYGDWGSPQKRGRGLDPQDPPRSAFALTLHILTPRIKRFLI